MLQKEYKNMQVDMYGGILINVMIVRKILWMEKQKNWLGFLMEAKNGL